MKRGSITLAVLVGLLVIGSALSLYLLRLNRETAVSTPDSPSPPVMLQPSLTITVVDGPAYVMDGKQYDLPAIKNLLLKERDTVKSVRILAPAEKGFGATVLLLDEVRRQGISHIKIESAGDSATKPAQTP